MKTTRACDHVATAPRRSARRTPQTPSRQVESSAEAALRLIPREIRIAIVRDEVIARDGLAALLAQYEDLFVVASVAHVGAAGLGAAEPEIVLVEAGFTHPDRAQLATSLGGAAASAKIIVTGVSPDNCDIVSLVRAGIAGFVIKDAPISELAVTIRSVAGGAQVVPPALIEAVSHNGGYALERRHASNAAPSMFDLMTPREREITLLIASGECNKQIAVRTFISTHTVKSHVRNIMEKLGIHSRLMLAVRANSERWRTQAGRSERAEPVRGS
jgi:DNA-binding NarL/FixJ family response regulator